MQPVDARQKPVVGPVEALGAHGQGLVVPEQEPGPFREAREAHVVEVLDESAEVVHLLECRHQHVADPLLLEAVLLLELGEVVLTKPDGILEVSLHLDEKSEEGCMIID